ncbi:MAG: hypothetical protein HQK56_20895, partial [Deltaproteobacteria bacterium]|nr:hypothetical protein [Deltaproteobacteria bacterium]
RVAEREQTVNKLQDDTARLEQSSQQLAQEKEKKQIEIEQSKADLAALEDDLAQIEEQNNQLTSLTHEQLAEKRKLNKKLAIVRSQIQKVKNNKQMGEKEKKAEINRLKKEIGSMSESAKKMQQQ